MQTLPAALRGFASYRQFLLYKLVWNAVALKFDKYPVSPLTGASYLKGSNWQQDPSQVTDFETASLLSAAMGEGYGVAFLFKADDPFYFVDLDNCTTTDGQGWSDVANAVLQLLPGAAIEVSQSGKGLHIFGTGICPPHGCKNIPLGLELYTQDRFVALTGDRAMGDCLTDSSATLPVLVDTFFGVSISGVSSQWTTEPVEGWDGIEDDAELVAKAFTAKSAGSIFGNSASFKDLWLAEEAVLSLAYPSQTGKPFDASSADAALAQHLAFWTGGDCARIERLMRQSALVRDKWDREEYVSDTITKSVGQQSTFHGMKQLQVISESLGAGKLRASSEGQRNFADSVRETKLGSATTEERAILTAATGAVAQAKFWLNNQEATPTELVKMVQPVMVAKPVFNTLVEIVSGFQYLNANLQMEHFAGCVYVQDIHRIFTPGGTMLKSEQFNASFGGYVFQLDESGDKTTRKAWEAFTESQVVRFPKVESTCFRPELPPGSIIEEEGQVLLNSYVEVQTPRVHGDPSPFLKHVALILPDQHDQQIILSYLAACIQYKGVKFQWAPLIQGAEGNGKTLLTRCVAFALGSRYTHLPPANEISEKFNEWLFNKLFIGIEDVFVSENKREVLEILKPMITNDRLAMRAMQQSQVMGDNRANFILNSNHKDGVRKTKNDRRFAPFFCAQQNFEDLARDGMDGDYFPKMYNWLRNENGYAIVADFLTGFAIPDALNPATHCSRAPETSTTHEAISAGLGSVEHEVLEAIDEGRVGFAGGWVSSMALESLLNDLRATRVIPSNRRREVLQTLGYDWHPHLIGGRVNNPIAIDGNRKPRLFIKRGHICENLISATEIVKHYVDAQNTIQVTSSAVSIFKP